MNHSVEQKIFISGPAGRLEARVSANLCISNENLNQNSLSIPLTVAVVCHPHPLFQGTMDNKIVTTLIRTFRDLPNLPMATVRFNFRGVGESEGEYAHGIGEMEDLRAVINWLAAKTPNIKLWLAGFSFGAMVSIKMAQIYAAHPPAHAISDKNIPDLQGLISVAPAIQFLDSLEFLHPNCPWLIIQGEQDEIVPIDTVKNWYEKFEDRPELIILPKATHFFHGHLQDIKDHVTQFVTRYS